MNAFLSALTGRCPRCHEGHIRESLLTMRAACDVCGVRFERWSGNWLFPVVLAYGAGGLFALAVGIYLLRTDRLEGAESWLIPLTLAVTMLSYPLCQNLTVWLLYVTGYVFEDPGPKPPRR